MTKTLPQTSRNQRVKRRATQPRPTHTSTSLASLFTAENTEQLKAFLAQFPYLVPLLHEAAQQLPQVFPGAELRLQVRHDPEATDQAELVLAVVTSLPATAALDHLDEFDARWWLANAQRAQGNLCVTLAFA